MGRGESPVGREVVTGIRSVEGSLFKNKRVFLTGHTGFKGSWLVLWLHQLGAKVYGYSLPPPTTPCNYSLSNVRERLADETIGDIRDHKQMLQAVQAAAPDVVFHLAAQPLVLQSYSAPAETFGVNVMGTASVLDAVRALKKPCAVVCITSDKCYENREQVLGYRETDPMGGYDPYSASKGAAELLIVSYRRSFFNPEKLSDHGVQLASARSGNVIGGGDWGCDRIITDIVTALTKGQEVSVRNPHSIRPWQHVLEPLSGYLKLAAVMLQQPSAKWAEAWNFGPVSGGELSVGLLADAFIKVWGSGSWLDTSDPAQAHEAKTLRLCIEKAEHELGWQPRWNCAKAIEKTVRWYRQVLLEGADAQALCLADIAAYEKEGS